MYCVVDVGDELCGGCTLMLCVCELSYIHNGQIHPAPPPSAHPLSCLHSLSLSLSLACTLSLSLSLSLLHSHPLVQAHTHTHEHAHTHTHTHTHPPSVRVFVSLCLSFRVFVAKKINTRGLRCLEFRSITCSPLADKSQRANSSCKQMIGKVL